MSDYARIKKELHPIFVMWVNGHQPVETLPGKYVYHSPFRQDSNPSFDIYFNEGQGCWKYGDWAEGSGGDVIDLLERFGMGIADAWALLGKQAGWTPPPVPEPKPFDGGYFEGAEGDLADALGKHWLHHAPSRGALDHEVPAWLDGTVSSWYHDEWRLKADGSDLLIPYYNHPGDLVGFKTRPVEGLKKNAAGSKLCL